MYKARECVELKKCKTREFREGAFSYSNSYPKLKTLVISPSPIPFSLAQCYCRGSRNGIFYKHSSFNWPLLPSIEPHFLSSTHHSYYSLL